MKVTTDIKRYDLIWVNLYSQLRSIMLYLMFGFFSITTFHQIYTDQVEKCDENIALAVFTAVVYGLLVTAFCSLFCIAWMLLNAGNNLGLLGLHEHSQSAKGFFQSTDVDESLWRWHGVKKVSCTKRYLLIWVNNYMCHILPMRSFGSKEGFEKFSQTAVNYWRDARRKN